MIKLIELKANNFKQLQGVHIRFPTAGSVMIEGRNEAGKSTLFEAVFFAMFGKTLVHGTSVQDLIAYNANEAIIELTLLVSEGSFAIHRRIRRTRAGASAEARLRILDVEGADVEEIRGASAVNQRIGMELRLDADAFLNSCFVEQKKLEKLEGMSRRDRETSLMRLLNLDRLHDEERALAPTPEEMRQLERQCRRVDLAEVMAEIPRVRAQGQEVTRDLGIIAMKEELARLLEHETAAEDTTRRIENMRLPLERTEAALDRVRRVRAAIGEVEVALARLRACEQADGQAADLRAERDALNRLECEGLAALNVRYRRVCVLRSQWERVVGFGALAEEVRLDLEGSRHRLRDWEAARAAAKEAEARVQETTAPIAEREERLSRVAALRRAADEVDGARLRLSQIETSERDLARLDGDLGALNTLERDGLPALATSLRRASILCGWWARIGRLEAEERRLSAEAEAARERLARAEAAVEMERGLEQDTRRLDEMEARAQALARRERVASVRQALEDWQAADHARRGLAELDRRMSEARGAAGDAEAEERRLQGAEDRARGAANRAGTLLGASVAGAFLSAVGALALPLPALWVAFAVLIIASVALGTRRGRASSALRRALADLETGREAARASQTDLLRLEGQRENAVASHGAAAARLEAAVARLEAIEEPIPGDASEAARRLIALGDVAPDDNPAAIASQLAGAREEIAALRASLQERETALSQQRQSLETRDIPVLRASIERLETRAARITESALERWTAAAQKRAEALGVPVAASSHAAREAAAGARSRLEAQRDAARARIEGRAAIESERDARHAALAEQRQHLAAACPTANEMLGIAAPQTQQEADAAAARIAAALEDLDEAACNADLRALRETRLAASNESAVMAREATRLMAELRRRFGPEMPDEEDQWRAWIEAALEVLERRLARVDAVEARWTEIAKQRATRLEVDVATDPERSRDAASRAESVETMRIREARESLRQRPALTRRLADLETRTAEERRVIAASFAVLADLRREVPGTAAMAGTILDDLSAELATLDEASARTEHDRLMSAVRALELERNEHQIHARETRTALREGAARLRLPEDMLLHEAAIAEVLPRWNEVAPDQKVNLEARFESLRAEHGYLVGKREDLARQLGLDPESARLSVEEERAEYDLRHRDYQVRQRAAEILGLARDRIVEKVLPHTIHHMRRILPALTMERYHDARLTDDYRIEVWDERAGMWKTKNIFSGGTRDQFSLALRLAFAMATLPRERGAAPAFIFLDEPLSSFDVERAEALMDLLTRGEVARTFDQIFVISHNQSLSRAEFRHRLRLDGGRVNEASRDMTPEPGLLLPAGEG